MLNVILAAAFGAALWSGMFGDVRNLAPGSIAGPALVAQATSPETAVPIPPEPALSQTPAPSQTPVPVPSQTPVPHAAPQPVTSGVSPAPSGEPHRGVPRGAVPDVAPADRAPAPSGSAPGRFHLHRPGTDVDGDVLTGSLASQAYILKGNVTLHSDPKIDREIADASESQEPLTVTADEIDVDRLGYSYVAKGHVHFVQGTRSGRADLATLNEQTHSLDLVGDANVYQGDHRTVADRFHYDMLDKSFRGSGDVRIFEPLPTPVPGVATPAPKHKRRLPL